MALTKILAAVDRLPQNEAVLVRALEIAKRHGAALTIVHVVDLPRHVTLPAQIDTLQGQAEFAARDRIDEALRRHGAEPTDIRIRIEDGSPALRLIEICDEFEPDLVVMRAHQKVKIAEKLLGSTTERVIASVRAPVLVVKWPARKAYANALLATDGTDDASGALQFVSDLLPDAALHLVQVVQIAPQLEEAMLRIGTGQDGLAAHRDELANAARENLRALAATIAPPATTQVLRGDPSRKLARATHGPDVDLIALGPGRTSLIQRAFIGSVTRRLLRDATCDVLICRPTQSRV